MTRALCLAALVLAGLLSFWSTDLNTPSIELIADEAKRFGFIEEAPSVDELIWSGAKRAGAS